MSERNVLTRRLQPLDAWNSILGRHGEHCDTAFLRDEYYCVGVSGPLPAPGPVQAGVIDTCTRYAKSNRKNKAYPRALY